MATLFGSVRRHIFTPSLHDVTFAARGFPVTPSAATRRLEAIPQSVICGFEWGIETKTNDELERRLEFIDAPLRGFAYEGAAMALTVLDAMRPGSRSRARELLTGAGRPHTLLTYIGIGFAMSHLPRPLWRNVIPDLSGTAYYPTMSWLAVDGYGFDLAYFHTDKWVRQQRRPAPYAWEGDPDYFLRACDQGVGRALWFIHGGQPADVAATVAKFAEHRRADLWSGVGLAATFAGGTDPEGYATLRKLAAGHVPELAQGAVFAAKARDLAGCVPEHTGEAVGALTGLSVAVASKLADDVAAGGLRGDGVPAYEVWRRLLHAHFAEMATVTH
ncbi:DUF1702 family protein [Dactylosporangium sp. CS-047395]|uniref:DUF1702 family protein n=1 Tax=Dactylosporangium sp. CS-047395 TaxID=3239936 RepID=UPI003D902A05